MSRAIEQAQLVFAFSIDDLEANRKGKITAAQRARLKQRFWYKFLWGNIIPITFGVLLAVFGIARLVQGDRIENVWFGLGAAGVVGLCMAAVGLIEWWPYRKDLQAREPLQLRGKTELDRTRYRLQFVFRSDDTMLLISRQEFDAFQENKTYTLYYLPNTQAILSVEDR